MPPLRALVASLLLTAAAAGAQAAITYSETFNSGYAVGTLEGQNGWVSVYDGNPTSTGLHGAGTTFRSAGQVFDRGAGDLAIQGGNGDFSANYGSVVTGGLGLSASLTSAYYQFDARLTDGPLQFAIGPDGDGDGALEDSFGLGGREFGPWLNIFGTSVDFRPAVSGSPLANFSLTATAGDWVQIRVVMDFTADAGEGAGRLYYRNLTTSPGSDFTELTTTPLNLKIASQLGPTYSNPATWNGVYALTTTTAMAIDNIIVATEVPEPASAALLLANGAALLSMRRKRAR